MRRRSLVALLGLGSLAGCGFQLRGRQSYGFSSIAILPQPGGALASDLRRALDGTVQVLGPQAAPNAAQVVLELLQEQHEKTVVGVNSSGQVREFQLRIRVRIRIRDPQGNALAPEADILQQRDISFSESAALAKEAEEALLYRDMERDIVQQILRRLAAIRR